MWTRYSWCENEEKIAWQHAKPTEKWNSSRQWVSLMRSPAWLCGNSIFNAYTCMLKSSSLSVWPDTFNSTNKAKHIHVSTGTCIISPSLCKLFLVSSPGSIPLQYTREWCYWFMHVTIEAKNVKAHTLTQTQQVVLLRYGCETKPYHMTCIWPTLLLIWPCYHGPPCCTHAHRQG